MTHPRALLQTDVVASTRLAERLGDAATSALWQAHDRVARDLLRDWHGREIDKSDGFLLLFDDVAAAVGYALAYHRALARLDEPLEARAGLHVGPVIIRENAGADVARGAKPIEIDGLAKPTVARIMALARGGQTLLTAAAQAALGPTPLRLQPHGCWRLHGIEQPFELFEVGEAHAPFAPPPDSEKAYRVVRAGDLWLPLRDVRHSLPAERDGFVGRQDDLQRLAQRFGAGARLVSVLGLGGTGKTRLAQRFGWTWLGDHPGGVWFCDLSPARTLDGLVYAVAQGLGVPLGGADPVAQVGSAIAGRGACLMILDNFEQVARHAEATLGQWLDRAGDARFLVTSREVLGIGGEHVVPLAPLPAVDGAVLFAARAASARPGFDPVPDDRAAIAPLVRLLDGLPLAIELAAARVRVMSPRTLLERMGERFKLLTSGTGRHDRQATLRATFDWSWELLTPAEKSALAQLSVFEGGFTLDTAEAVIDLSACADAPWTPDVIQSLVDKSFVRQVVDERFDLLVSVQAYAAELLGRAEVFPGSGPEAVEGAFRRHWRCFAGLAERSAAAVDCVDTDNLVLACRRAAAHGDAGAAADGLLGSWAALQRCGPFRVGLALAETVGGMAGLSRVQRGWAHWVAGSALFTLARCDAAEARFRAGLAEIEGGGDPGLTSRLLCGLGSCLTAAGRAEAASTRLQAALASARTAGDKMLECHALNSLGELAGQSADTVRARDHYEAALALARGAGDLRYVGGLLGNLATLHFGAGQLDTAVVLYEEALALIRSTGDRRWEGNTHCNLGLLHHEQGRDGPAARHLEAALSIARDIGHARLESTVLCNLGIVRESEGDLPTAQCRYEEAVAAAGRLGDRRAEGQFRAYLGLLHARRGHFDAARRCLATGAELLTGMADRIGLGLLLCSQAETEWLANDVAAANSYLALAIAVVDETSVPSQSELGSRVAQLRRWLRVEAGVSSG